MSDRRLVGKRIAFLAAPEGTEQVELTEPWKAVEQAGGRPELVSTGPGEIQAFNHLDKVDTLPVDRTLGEASYPSVLTDIENAGGEWVDEEVVVDQGLVSSRKPGDLPAFCSKIVEEFCEGRHEAMARSA